jgi:death on curing protein
MKQPKWIAKAVALALHQEQISEHGGSDGMRDDGLLDSALARPQNLFAYSEPDLFDLAASYASGIAQNHAFIDGNKRTALTVAATFLYIHGLDIVAPKEALYTTVLSLADGSLSEGALAIWFREHTERLK